MQMNLTNSRRLGVLYRILNQRNKNVNIRLCSTNESVTIGNITKVIKEPKNAEYVPRKYLILDSASQSTIHHLRWMLQKDLLGQDVFLLGPPGPSRRLLAFQYLELTKRELEYVALSRDTTEADLKQRREIISGTAKYFDQSAVRAAIEGRVLVLEGIEKAERNVLPVLNNLLENREMHLEDGRLLIPANRYDQLLEKHGKDELEKWKLVRVDEDFRVIALGLPVPRYAGNLLDPPLRSRFQARDVSHPSYQENLTELQSISTEINPNRIEHLTNVAYALLSDEIIKLNLPQFPIDNLSRVVKIMASNSTASTFELFYRLYPYKTFLQAEGIKAVENLLETLKVLPTENTMSRNLESIKQFFRQQFPTKVVAKETNNNNHCKYIETDYQNHLINELLTSCTVSDICLIGPRGCGKSITIQKLAEILGYEIEPIVLYQDMTSRDLIQQRTTLLNGDTVWKNSPLIMAALSGKMAILDGIHRMHPSTLAVLHRLVHDREIQLHDGKRLIEATRYDDIKLHLKLTDEEMFAKGISKIHPQFRIVALAEPPSLNSPSGNWLSSEILSLFLFHEMRTLSKEEEMKIITSMYGSISKRLHKIINLAHTLRDSSDPTLKNLSGSLSTRQLLHIASRMAKYPHTDSYDIVQRTFLSKFLPNIARNALESIIFDAGLQPTTVDESQKIKCEVNDGVLTIGNTSLNVYQTDSPTKIPNILFFDVPQHIRLLEYLLQDFILGSHLLLVGNQGVGKNKIADRLLQLLNRPREYIQLHRDTTVQTLTLQPSVKDGLVIYEDSPLVKAVKFGHILVVDEADKAPTHVTCILKTLVESGEMILSDGRRIVKPMDTGVGTCADIIETHPDFRMIVLANRPGFPFLGNDFFGALGDLFSCHAVDNPSIESEISLLTQYGPDVPKDIIQKLVLAFGELRTMADQGLVSYPYSTREVVNIIKHIQKFPNEDIATIIFNVFDFDRYNDDVIQTLAEVLAKYGFPSQELFTKQWLAIQKAKEHLQVTVNRKSGLDTSAPKHGKEDPNNDPHVGGNTWAGGTGGRDTAGLGGKGGPYRLDKGHKVHQLSDEEKDAVPEHVKKAAREMNRKAFKDKLKEIDMSEYDANLYGQFYDAVSRPIQSLRVVLSSLQAKSKERQWTRHQTSGELDDNKLIEGITGEKTIYRRRADHDPDFGTPQVKPKRLKLVVDVSGSMYRFNSYDGRLDRELEAVVLVMEAFEGYEDKFKYDIVGHSGDHYNVEFVTHDKQPKNNKERLDVIRHMHAHSQYCWNGDHTLEATTHAIKSLAMEDCDEAIVVVLSDANLSRYGISAKTFANVLSSNPKVSAHAIFIGSLGDQAENLVRTLPSGRGFVCTDCSELPQILKQIFTASVLR